MKYLNVALLLMMSFTLPVNHPAERTPAAEVRSPVDELLKAAIEARERGDYERAEKILREAQQIDSANADVGYYLGLTLFNLAKLTEAETELRSVLRINALYVDAKIALGRVLIALGKFPESERLLREAVAQSPDKVETYDALASLLLALKKNDEAIFILDLGLGRIPESPVLLIKKGMIYFINRDLKKASEIAETLTGLTDIIARYQGHLLLGKIAFEKTPGTIEVAESQILEAIDLEPIESEAYLTLSDIYISLWKFDKARALLEQAMDVVKDRSVIEKKLASLADLQKDVLNFSVFAGLSETSFKDGSESWKDFYLNAVWRIDPYKTLVFGFEKFARGGMHDETLKVEYIEKINKWVYLYMGAKVTVDPDFREENAFKFGTNFVLNPLKTGSTIIVAEAEAKTYDSDNIYFLTAGVDQNFGKNLVVSVRYFRVLTETQKDDFWTVKTTWSLTPRLDVSAHYGTMTEDISGRPLRGSTRGIGAEYRLDNRVSITGNYARINNDQYRANQVTVGLRVKFGPSTSSSSSSSRPRYEERAPAPRYETREPAPRSREGGKGPSARKPEPVKEEPAPKPVKKKKRFFFF